jgi:hypothetical protein
MDPGKRESHLARGNGCKQGGRSANLPALPEKMVLSNSIASPAIILCGARPNLMNFISTIPPRQPQRRPSFFLSRQMTSAPSSRGDEDLRFATTRTTAVLFLVASGARESEQNGRNKRRKLFSESFRTRRKRNTTGNFTPPFSGQTYGAVHTLLPVPDIFRQILKENLTSSVFLR